MIKVNTEKVTDEVCQALDSCELEYDRSMVDNFVEKLGAAAIYDLTEEWFKRNLAANSEWSPDKHEVKEYLSTIDDSAKSQSVIMTFQRSFDLLIEKIAESDPDKKAELQKSFADIEVSQLIVLR